MAKQTTMPIVRRKAPRRAAKPHPTSRSEAQEFARLERLLPLESDVNELIAAIAEVVGERIAARQCARGLARAAHVSIRAANKFVALGGTAWKPGRQRSRHVRLR
jgi:hypothetical protein